MNIEFIWRKGATAVEALPGGKAFLFRFHVDPEYIPGDVLSNCVVAETAPYEAEVKAWGGRRGPTTTDRKAIEEFCKMIGFNAVCWWRAENGKPPKQVWLYR